MRMTCMTCVLVVCALFFYEFCCINFLPQLRYEESSLQTRVSAKFGVGFEACFLNGFIVMLKMLYMYMRAKFEVGFEACFLKSKNTIMPVS